MDPVMQQRLDKAAEVQFEHSMNRCPYGNDEQRREYARQLGRRCAAYADREPDAKPEPTPEPEPPTPPEPPAPPTPEPEPEPEIATDPAPADDDPEPES